jgi:hypothetical protein
MTSHLPFGVWIVVRTVIVGMMPPTKRAAFDALSSAFASLSTSAVEGAPRPAQEQTPPQPTRRLYRLAHTTKSTKEDETRTALVRILPSPLTLSHLQ